MKIDAETMKNYTYHLVAVLTVGIWGLTFISTKVFEKKEAPLLPPE